MLLTHVIAQPLPYETHLLDKLGKNIIYISTYRILTLGRSESSSNILPLFPLPAGRGERGKVKGNFKYFR